MAARACLVACVVVLLSGVGCARKQKVAGTGTGPASGVVKASVPDYGRPLPAGKMALVKIAHPSQMPDVRPAFWRMGMLGEAIDHSLSYLAHPSSRKYFPYLDVSHDRAVATLRAFKQLIGRVGSAEALQEAIRSDYEVYQSVGWDGQGQVLFTGYCQPVYEASRQPDATYRYPLYRRPPDLVTDPAEGTCLGRRTRDGLVPYYTRREIESRHLLAGLELVYLKDRLEAYIVHVQGSARLRLPDGTLFEVGYHGKTEHPYASLGQELIKDGKVSRGAMSLSRIKAHFQAHPEELEEYLYRNGSYIFFRPTVGGPFGCLGVPVTPYHSLATDKQVYPRACLAMVATTLPTLGPKDTCVPAPFTVLALDQDRGGRDPCRGSGGRVPGHRPASRAGGRPHRQPRPTVLPVPEAEPGRVVPHAHHPRPCAGPLTRDVPFSVTGDGSARWRRGG